MAWINTTPKKDEKPTSKAASAATAAAGLAAAGATVKKAGERLDLTERLGLTSKNSSGSAGSSSETPKKAAGSTATQKDSTTKKTSTGGIGKVSGVSSTTKKTSTGTNRSTHTGIIGRAAQQKAQNEGQAALSGLAGGLNQSWQNIAQANKTAQQRATGGGTLGNLAPAPETAMKSGQKLGGALLTGNLTDAQFGQPTVSPEQAAQEAEERTAATQEALRTGNWQHFAPADGSGYAIVRPDDAALLGTTEQQGFDPLAIVTQQEFGERQQRQADEKTYDTPAIREEELRRADQQQSAVQKSLTAATGGAIQGALGMATVSPAQRTAKEMADEQWQGVVDRYIESTPYYQGEKARLDTESAQIDAALEATDAQIAEMDAAMQAQGYFTPGDLNAIDDARKQRRQLLMLKYENSRYSDTLKSKAQAVETDEGRLEGTLTTDERLRYGLSPEFESDGTFFGEFMARTNQAIFMGDATMQKVANGAARDMANVIATASAAAGGYDSVYDYMADNPTDTIGGTLAQIAFDPTLDNSRETIDYGGDAANAIQWVGESGLRMAYDYTIGKFAGGAKGIGGLLKFAVNAAPSFAEASNTARESGASAGEMLTAGTAAGTINATLDIYGYDKLENAAKGLLGKLTPGVRKLIPGGMNKLISHPATQKLLNVIGAAVEEGAEEMGENVVHGAVRKAVYDDESEWFGENGVINPRELLIEGGMGALFGGLFGVAGALEMDVNTESRQLADEIMRRAYNDMPIDERLAALGDMVQADARKAEIAPADVAAHEALWMARQQEVPQSLVAWQNAAQQAQSAQAAHTAARNALAQLMADAESGAVDLESKSGMQLYGTAMQRVRQAAGELARAAQLNVAMRDAYYADEDALVEGIEVKHAALEEIASTITTDITEATGGAATEYMLQSAEVQTAMRQVRAAMLAQMSARGDIDAAMEAMHLADGPDAMLEAEVTTDAMLARADEADAAVEAAREELRRTVMTEADYAARMAEGRAENAAMNKYDSAYDNVDTPTLTAMRDEQVAKLEARQAEMQSARGAARRRIREELASISSDIETMNAELTLRERIYGPGGDNIGIAPAPIAQDAAATDALDEAAQALRSAVNAAPDVAARGYTTASYDRQTAAIIRAMEQEGADIKKTPDEWRDITGGYDYSNDASSLRAWMNKEAKRNDGKVTARAALDFLMQEQAADAASMAQRSKFYQQLYGKGKVRVQPMPVVEIKDSAGKNRRYGDVAQKLRTRFGDDISFVNADTEATIHVGTRGIQETLFYASKTDADMLHVVYSTLENIDQLIENGVYVGSQINYRGDENNPTVHNFVAAVKHNGALYRVEYNVRESVRGNNTRENFYFERISRIEAQKKQVSAAAAPVSSDQEPTQRIGAATTPVGNSIPDSGAGVKHNNNDNNNDTKTDVEYISIKDLLAGYNLHDKKLWPLKDLGGGEQTMNLRMFSDPTITMNGSPLLTRMTDNELAEDIAYANRLANDPDPDIAAAGQSRRETLRQERAAREERMNAPTRMRQEHLNEINAQLDAIAEQSDNDLGRQRRWLEGQQRRLDNLVQEVDGDEQRMYMRQLHETETALEAVKSEQAARRDARRTAARDLMAETDEELREGGREPDDRERIQRNQEAGRKAVQRLNESRDRGLRITDTISIEDAATVFADTEGMADTGDATTADMLLRHNAAQLVMWEERRAQLQSAAGEMRMELRDLMQAQETPDADADPSEQARMLGRIESLRDGIERANALAKRADTEIRYYAAHGAEGVTESLQSGHIAEPLMERIMGIVDVMKGDGAGGLAGYHMNTPDRVFDDHFGQNAPVMRAIYIDPIKKAEAERTRYMRQVIADLKALKLNKEERALVQQYGERKISAQQLEAAITNKLAARGQRLKSGAGTHKGGETFEGVGDRADEMQRIAYAAETIHNWYVQMHGMVNEALEANGYEKIGEIENYFPHFEGEEGNALKRAFRKLGLAAPDFSIPTDIAGMTETFSPGHKYSAHTQHRTGDKTTYDAIEGMDRYLDSMTQIAFHTGNIKRLRQLESAIRAGEKSGTLTGRGQGNEDFGHMAMWLHEYANQLAGKKANIMGDRQLENLLGRRAYGALDKLVKHKGAAAVALSLSSALSNSIPVAEVMTKHGIHLPRMLGRLIAGAKDSTKAMPQSDFLTRRFGTDELSETLLEALMKKASKLFEKMDELAAHIVVRTCYEANIAHGMDPESAIMSADAEAARLMADRSKGALPTIFGSRVFTATLGQFQIEPVNQFARLLKDTFRESGEVSGVKTTSKGMEQKTQLSGAAKVKGMASLALFAVMSNLVNQLWERLMGRDIQPDPIGIGEDMVHTYQETGDWYRTLAAGANGVMEQVPFFSGGRVGTNTFGEMVEDLQTVQKAIEATLSGSEDAAYLWDKVAWMPSYYATGGGQFRKIYQGIGKVMQDGVFNKNGQLMYPIDTTNGWVRAQAALFGYSSTEYARKYWDEGRSALNDDNTQKYLELVEDGMSPIDAYESLYAYQQAGSLYSKYAKAIKAGDTAGAQTLRAEIAALTEQVDYAAVIPAVGRDELGKPYMAMLERAWRESGNKAFMPEYYYGEFTSKGVSYKFTPEAMATLQGVFERELADEMEQYSAAWPAMTAEERAEAYSDAKSEARKAAKQYGFDNKLPYVTEQAYVEAGYTAPEDAPGAEMQPGLTNPIGDIYRMATGEPVGTAKGGFAEDMGKLFTGTGAVNSPETPQQLLETEQQIEAQTGNPGGGSSGGSGGSRRRSSSGRSSGGSTEQQPGEAASYWQRQARAAFGEDYTPAPVDASIDMPDGSRRQLTGDDATIYERLYNAFMTVYMWSGLEDWNTADMQGRMALLADMMQRARAAAGDFWQRFYGSGMGRYTIEAESNNE